MNLTQFDNQILRLTDRNGQSFTGIAFAFLPAYGLHEYGREEDGIQIGGHVIFASDILSAEPFDGMAILRATETWQQAGAFYVRIQAMAKKHHITLRQEFDEHDGPNTRYIVVTDLDFPVATARMYELDESSVMIGRVVVLPEYRHRGIGSMVVTECESWAGELGYRKAVLESRDNKIEFYQKMAYEITGEMKDEGTFRCIRMQKELRQRPKPNCPQAFHHIRTQSGQTHSDR